MAIVKVTVKLRQGTNSLSNSWGRFECGMNVEIVDPEQNIRSGVYHFTTKNVELIKKTFADKYGVAYGKMSYDFICERMVAEVL